LRGFILHTQLVKEEDLVVTILTRTKILKLYRFYGARHSIVNEGYCIDFELENTNVNIDRLRNVMHIGFPFLMDIDKMIVWQNFISLLYEHLRDVEEVDAFYFDLLNDMVADFKRDAKRVVIEHYARLLEFEGRLHTEFECFLCEKPIIEEVKLAQGFLPACKECIPAKGFDMQKIDILFNQKKTIMLNNDEVDKIYNILNLGM